MTNERRLIILKDGTKRELEFPFDICGSKEDLMLMIKQIEDEISIIDKQDLNHAYGWVKILLPFAAPIDQMGNGKEPLSWHEESKR
jgi:hypothetical protein